MSCCGKRFSESERNNFDVYCRDNCLIVHNPAKLAERLGGIMFTIAEEHQVNVKVLRLPAALDRRFINGAKSLTRIIVIQIQFE